MYAISLTVGITRAIEKSCIERALTQRLHATIYVIELYIVRGINVFVKNKMSLKVNRC